MNNLAYRRSRGTDKPFDGRHSQEAWYECNREAIDARRQRDKQRKRFLRRRKRTVQDEVTAEDED